jgi:hypothetical protein
MVTSQSEGVESIGQLFGADAAGGALISISTPSEVKSLMLFTLSLPLWSSAISSTIIRPGPCSLAASISAVVYGNAFLELLTNKESSLSALASAILGETVCSDLHNQKNRIPEMGYKISEIKDEVEAGLAAYYIAKLTKNHSQSRSTPR